MLISKKDLLIQTGISYGQLYRWKREGLIPEGWFLKQPSFTGQETFFPKEKILARITAIQALKDKYSLEELARILSPEVSERSFTRDDLFIIEEIDNGLVPCFMSAFEKDTFTYVEVLVLIALTGWYREYKLQISDIEKMCAGIRPHMRALKQTDYMLLIFKRHSEYFIALQQEQAQVFYDERLKILRQVRLEDLSSGMKLKYRKSFDFKAGEAAQDLPVKDKKLREEPV